ncbi:EAL domain-containing protein [Massilia sp. PAMC28688]|uniref:sensor domain-containing phosphodiesterase n=1 Tax=Massilia sp. PAMC28688 TaxID=2861283 RepID=UPI001C6258BD|nr:GGDEF domain-containing phosphodiesterase [Massilia sp. PAMC28688]QYF92318.1 EAL domain-containing protein [Massilia sp. PAMC28688]
MSTTNAACLPREIQRLEALRKLNILDTVPSDSLDRITRMAAQLFGLPIAAVSLTDHDRQWFKSKVGVEHDAIPRYRAPCAQVADHNRVVVVPDLLQDPEFCDSTLARSGIRFYAGAPLTTSDGHCLGAVCVLGQEPREVTAQELASLQDMAAMVMTQIELQHAIGRMDSMSGLPNRNQFREDVDELARLDPHSPVRLAVVVNLATPQQLDSAVRVMGSSYLDGLLEQAAGWLKQCIGPGTRLYHVGTSKFAFVADAGTEISTFTAVAKQWLVQRRQWGAARYVTTVTFGLASFVPGAADGLDVLRRCHNAAQDAEDAEQDVGWYSAAQDETYQRRFTLLNAFSAALESEGQLSLVFQPRVDLATGRWLGAEALLRWTHPTLGPVSPAEFIPIVEKTSIARATTEWVMEAAMLQLAAWRDAGMEVQVAVNVSATNLIEPDFAEGVIARLQRHGLPPRLLEIEVTESAVMTNPVQAEQALRSLSAAGISLAIDDFGTGYSSLAYLQKLPANVVKIDRSFIQQLEQNPDGALVKAMIVLLHQLNYRVVAEGIETAAMGELLQSMGCDEAQGYWYARPLPSPAFLSGWQAQAAEQA